MTTSLWITQGILASLFAMAGAMKSTQSIDKLLKSGITWAGRFSLTTIRVIGISELLGAFGLILPWLLKIAPALTPIAALSLALVQLLAIFHHAKNNESKAIVFNIFLLALAAFVAWGRFSLL